MPNFSQIFEKDRCERTYSTLWGFWLIWARRANIKTVVASQGASTDLGFFGEKLWLELSDGDENWHER